MKLRVENAFVKKESILLSVFINNIDINFILYKK